MHYIRSLTIIYISPYIRNELIKYITSRDFR